MRRRPRLPVAPSSKRRRVFACGRLRRLILSTKAWRHIHAPRYNRSVLCNRAKATVRLAAVIAFAVLVASGSNTFAAPQTSPKAFPSAADVHATVAEIVLPTRLATDKPATLAVLDSQGRLAPGVSVELSTGTRVVTNAGGEARFVAGSSAGILTASVPGTPVQAASPVIASTGDSPSAVAIAKYPRVITRAEHFPVTGFNFRGDADLDRVKINDQPALVLAASPFALEISPGPGLALGRANLQIKVAARSLHPRLSMSSRSAPTGAVRN